MDLRQHALVLIDLQRRIVALETQPDAAALIVVRSVRLATAFHQAGQPVIAVRTVNLDAPDPAGDLLVEDIAAVAHDAVITKHTVGAFHGMPLDLHLRRLGVRGLVLAGLMTNFGVESTARAADEHGYLVVFAADAMASFSAEAHAFALDTIFPHFGAVVSTEAILAALAGAPYPEV